MNVINNKNLLEETGKFHLLSKSNGYYTSVCVSEILTFFLSNLLILVMYSWQPCHSKNCARSHSHSFIFNQLVCFTHTETEQCEFLKIANSLGPLVVALILLFFFFFVIILFCRCRFNSIEL